MDQVNSVNWHSESLGPCFYLFAAFQACYCCRIFGIQPSEKYRYKHTYSIVLTYFALLFKPTVGDCRFIGAQISVLFVASCFDWQVRVHWTKHQLYLNCFWLFQWARKPSGFIFTLQGLKQNTRERHRYLKRTSMWWCLWSKRTSNLSFSITDPDVTDGLCCCRRSQFCFCWLVGQILDLGNKIFVVEH